MSAGYTGLSLYREIVRDVCQTKATKEIAKKKRLASFQRRAAFQISASKYLPLLVYSLHGRGIKCQLVILPFKASFKAAFKAAFKRSRLR
jgi:hypothetical protein